jgi:ribosomal protein S21
MMYIGRTAFVVNGAVDAGYKRLNLILQRNGVRRELKRAERHEKKGVKRRRLSSQRWRTKFAHEVRSPEHGSCYTLRDTDIIHLGTEEGADGSSYP